MERKKIVYVISAIKKTGPNRVLENMIAGIDFEKYKIYVISFLKDEQNEKEKLEKIGATCINLNLKSKKEILLYGYKKIINHINEISPQVVHSHGLLPDIIVSKIKSIKKITTIHCNIYEDYRFSFGKFKGIFFYFIHRMAISKMDIAICCSETVYNSLSNKNEKYIFIRNGIKTLDIAKAETRLKIRQALKIDDNAIVYIYIGALTQRKNVKEMCELFSKHANADELLLILGAGEQYDNICNMDKRIKLLGFKENVTEYICASDVYLSASKSEGLSISIIEAMDKNLCLLLSDIDSHKEFFKLGADGYQGEVFNKENFEEKITNIRQNIKKEKVINKKLKEMYLSEKVMMEHYMKEYDNG